MPGAHARVQWRRMGVSAVELQQVGKVYREGDAERVVLRDVSVVIRPGEIAVVLGRSGSGKSTLLNLIAGLDKPTSGSVRVGGAEVSAMTPSQLATWRSENVGFVFQQFNLLPVLTAFQNVELPLLLTRRSAGFA